MVDALAALVSFPFLNCGLETTHMKCETPQNTTIAPIALYIQ